MAFPSRMDGTEKPPDSPLSSTLRIPFDIYDGIEKSALQSLLPSMYEISPNTFRTYEIAALQYVLYKSCRYSVPRSYAFKPVRYKVVDGKIHIYDKQLNHISSHNLSERKGSINQFPEHRKLESGDGSSSIVRF